MPITRKITGLVYPSMPNPWSRLLVGQNHRRMASSDLSRSGCHDDNDERRRLFKRSAPSYVEGRLIVEIFSYADQRPRASPEAYAFAGFAKMSIHRWSRHQARLSYVEALAR